MTKFLAEEQFKCEVMPTILRLEKERNFGIDIPLRAEKWNGFIEKLYREGDITVHQYKNWIPPAICH